MALVEQGMIYTGIPDETKDKILQPFITTKKGIQKTGLDMKLMRL